MPDTRDSGWQTSGVHLATWLCVRARSPHLGVCVCVCVGVGVCMNPVWGGCRGWAPTASSGGHSCNSLVRNCSVAQSCPTLCDPVDCSPPGPSVLGILQARIVERVVIGFSRGSSRLNSGLLCCRRILEPGAAREALLSGVAFLQYMVSSFALGPVTETLPRQAVHAELSFVDPHACGCLGPHHILQTRHARLREGKRLPQCRPAGACGRLWPHCVCF